MKGLRTGLLFLASVAFAFAIAEVGLRIRERAFACHVERPDPAGLHRKDARYGHTLTPGYRGRLDGGCWETPIRVSSLGTRGPEIGPKAPATRRILLIGDSYIFGLGVNEESTLPSLLEAALNEAALPGEPAVEVINAGVPGWTTAQAALLVEDQARPLEIDEILLNIYLGNDLEERVRFEDRNAQEEKPAGEDTPAAGRRSLLPTSHLLRIVRSRWQEAAFRSGARRRSLDVWFQIYMRDIPDRVRRGYELVAGDLERMQRMGSEIGIPLRTLVTPSWMQAMEPAAESACRRFLCRADEINMRKPNGEIAAILDRSGMPFLDLTDPLVRAFGEKEYRFIVGHWDEIGTRLAAEQVSTWLRTQPR